MAKKKAVTKKVEEKKVETPVVETVEQPIIETTEVVTEQEKELDEQLEIANEETSGEPQKVFTDENAKEIKGEREYVKDWRELVAVEGVNQTSRGKLYYGVKRK